MKYLLICLFQVNGVDVSDCNHEEAVEIFMAATEPIVVEVKRRTNTTTVNNPQCSDKKTKKKVQNATQNEKKISREVQTEIETANNCMRCGDYYSYDTSNSNENLIFPDFEYEVMINKYGFS